MSMTHQIGERVIAIRDADKEEVRIFGYGVYTGDEIPPPDVGMMFPGNSNPKIVLDSGGVVWGCECWWGSEAAAEAKFIQGRRVVTVSLPERAAVSGKDAPNA